MCLSPLWRAVALEMQDSNSAQRQLFFSESLFFFFFKLISQKWKPELLHEVEWVEWCYSWGVWVGLQFTVTLLGSAIAIFSDDLLSLSHLWWAIKHFMLRKHILGLIKIAYRCFDSPSNRKEIRSHSLSFTSHPPVRKGGFGQVGARGLCVLRGQTPSCCQLAG